ncbi:MAG: hypothetical protein ACKOD5_11460 [Chthoniobacterales bacterium]
MGTAIMDRLRRAAHG